MSTLILRTATPLRKVPSNKGGYMKLTGGRYMKHFKLVFLVIVLGLMSSNLWAQEKLFYGSGAVYEGLNYGGWSVTLSAGTNEPNLLHAGLSQFGAPGKKTEQNFYRIISSIRIGRGLKCEFYKDINFKGDKLGPLGEGNYPDLRKNGWDDKIGSMKCYPAD